MKSQPQRSNRRNKHSRSRSSKKGGWGGWSRTTAVGPAWNGGNGSNFFAPSKFGITANPVPVSEFRGPVQATPLSPPLRASALSKSGGGGGSKTRNNRSRKGRSKRGGFVFGGFPQDMQIGWDNLKIGAQNMYRGFMGNNQLTSASPWNQPALNAKMGPSMPNFTDTNRLVANATRAVNNIK